MTHKCSNCGFRSTDGRFFRRERGGLLRSRQTVCDACVPYQPTAYDRRSSWSLLLSPFSYFLVIFMIMHGTVPARATLFPLHVLTAPTMPLRIFIHEAGHALVAG